MSNVMYKVGFWSAMIAFTAMLSFDISQVLQLLGVVRYPVDEILIYGTSLCITAPFLILMLALHHSATPDKKFWTHGALLFALMYVVFVTANYVVQLATVIPATLNGSASDIDILIQRPHSIFWDFDAIGYIFMGIAALFAIPAFRRTGIQKWAGYAFLAHALVTPLIAIVYFYPAFSERFLLLALPWGITAPASMLILALMFRKESRLTRSPLG